MEWHFTVTGPGEGVYEGGLYHGRIIFPADYPFSPPTLMFLTPSGRFQTATKICLSVTGFHPEHWQPAWGVRTMLIAIRDHFTTEDPGAIGYLGYPPEDRRRLALESRRFRCPACAYQPPRGALGNPEPETAEEATHPPVPPSRPTTYDNDHRGRPLTNAPLFGFLLALSVAVLILAINYYHHIVH